MQLQYFIRDPEGMRRVSFFRQRMLQPFRNNITLVIGHVIFVFFNSSRAVVLSGSACLEPCNRCVVF